MAGQIRYPIEGQGVVIADEGDVVYVPMYTFHAPRFHGPGALLPAGDQRISKYRPLAGCRSRLDGSADALGYRPVPQPRGPGPVDALCRPDPHAGGERARHGYCGGLGRRAELPQLPSPPHAFDPLLPLMALLPVLMVRLFARRPLRWAGAYLIFGLGVASHLALDSTNVYGVRLLLPFSARSFHLDITSVIDVWIWAGDSAGVGGRRDQPAGIVRDRREGRAAQRDTASPSPRCSFWCCTTAATPCCTARAGDAGGARISRSRAAPRGRFPGCGEPLAIPRPGGDARIFQPARSECSRGVRSQRRANFLQARAFAGARSGRAAPKPSAIFLGFAQYPYWRTLPLSEPEDAVSVEAMDLRFGKSSESGVCCYSRFEQPDGGGPCVVHFRHTANQGR